MKRTVSSALVLMLGLLMSHTQVSGQTPVGTAFTYQGRLEQNGSPVNESCDFQFELWDAASGGSQVGSTITTNGVTVTDGLFTVTVDFGENTFVGEARWLDISMRCPAGVDPYIDLPPRQRLTPTPNALHAANLQLPFTGAVDSSYDPVFTITNTDATSNRSAGAFYASSHTADGISCSGGRHGISASGVQCGVSGNSGSPDGIGVYGEAVKTSGYTRGVYGFVQSPSGTAVQGQAMASEGFTIGVLGLVGSPYGCGIWGDGGRYAIYGNTSVSGGYAGYFAGDVHVTGTLTGGKGGLKIDHPLDPTNKYLYHSFVESPDMMNVYNGNVITDANGHAEVVLPEWFEILNKDFRYQLTVIGQFAQAIVASKIKDNRFIIKTDKPHVEVSWQVTGIRKDLYAERYRIPVEEEKPEKHRGKYLHPELYGQPKESAVHYIPPREEPAAKRPATLRP